MDLSAVIGEGEFEITHIVTALADNLDPIFLPNETHSSAALPISITPIFAQALP